MDNKKLGKLPSKSNLKMLRLNEFLATELPPLLKKVLFWKNRTKFPKRSYGNRRMGCCTRASQAHLATRMERLEQRRTISVSDDEIKRVYFEMTNRLYGGGDTGAYESDALDEWRRPELTFRDQAGRPLTIDAYTRINLLDVNEVKRAILTAGVHGIKVCLNLPTAYANIDPPNDWDLPYGPLILDWQPGSWGGHSMSADGYDEVGVWLIHTWYDEDSPVSDHQRITWAAFSAYADEAYMVVDSVNAWKKKKTSLQIDKLTDAVNQVSSHKLEIR